MKTLLIGVTLLTATTHIQAAPLPTGPLATPVVVDAAGVVAGRFVPGFSQTGRVKPTVLAAFQTGFVQFELEANLKREQLDAHTAFERNDGFVYAHNPAYYADATCSGPALIKLPKHDTISGTRLVGVVRHTSTGSPVGLIAQPSYAKYLSAQMYMRLTDKCSSAMDPYERFIFLAPVIGTIALPAGPLYIK